MIGFGAFLIAVSIIILTMLIYKEMEGSFFGFITGIVFFCGVFILIFTEPTIQEKCKENAICYELVQTVAEYTNYTEGEVANFFIMVSDNVEAWDAVKMILDNPTEEQVNAIMEISAMKQAE